MTRPLFAYFFCIAVSLTSAHALPNGTGSPDAVVLDDSWHLWLDQQAQWRNDKLYLPDEVDLAKLPVNPPTGGWETLNGGAGIPVTLPGTVEEHYWGRAPLPTARPDRPSDIVNLSSPYEGVSWWVRNFSPPPLAPGDRLVFSFPGARLRAEVYVNGKLAGYNLVTETPFTADATTALKPGKENQLAVRITNPGGTFSWGDFGMMKWGSYAFTVSHGFGGLDGGVTMAVHGPVAVEDLYVANHPNPRMVTLNAQVVSTGPAYSGPLDFSISRAGGKIWDGTAQANIPAGSQAAISVDVTVPDAELWEIGHPALYRAEAAIASIPHSARVTDFGFRWFDAEDIGSNAHLVFNGRRIVVKSAISWGYWAPNGIFPDHAAVQREIAAAQSLGLNAIQNHRHFPKAAVLDGFDAAGLLRYCEPGGGGGSFDENGRTAYPNGPIDTSGTGGEPQTFSQRYAVTKLLAMVKAYRSHPSALLWTVQNESGANLHNPHIFWILRRMHELDPSRIVLLKSGFGPGGEVMGLPYDDRLTYGAGGLDSGWDDSHTADASQGVYRDQYYNGPADYPYYTTNSTAISTWGELATGASVDDVSSIAAWYRDHNIPGYDREAAETLSAAYEKFLDQYGFRADYPTAETLFRQIAAKHYFSAARLMENARMADQNDYIALSGWESTTIDNHSALVDALRHPKGDPNILKQATAPELLVVRPLHYVVASGSAAVADVHLVNESGLSGSCTLQFSAEMDALPALPFFQRTFFKTTFPVHVTGGEVFGELLKSNITFTPPAPGAITMRATLYGPDGSKILERAEPLLVVNPQPHPLPGPVACADYDGRLIPRLKALLGATGIPLASAPADTGVILISSDGAPRYSLDVSNPQRAQNVTNTDDPGLYAESGILKKGELAPIGGLAPGAASVELFFVEPYFDEPGSRAFDIAANGKGVLRNFDIFKEAGGKDVALVKKFSVKCPDGVLRLTVPNIGKDKALLAAIRVTDATGKVTRQVLRRAPYQSPTGETWAAAPLGGYRWSEVLPAALDRAREGARLVLLTTGGDDAGDAAAALAKAGVLTFSGSLGPDRTSWLGYWYFSRRHWLLDGLPSGCVLDWPFQAAAGGAGLRIDAPGLDPVIALGMNHSPVLGLGAAVIPLGKGEIVLLAIPGLSPAVIEGSPDGFQPVTAERILFNALCAK